MSWQPSSRGPAWFTAALQIYCSMPAWLAACLPLVFLSSRLAAWPPACSPACLADCSPAHPSARPPPAAINHLVQPPPFLRSAASVASMRSCLAKSRSWLARATSRLGFTACVHAGVGQDRAGWARAEWASAEWGRAGWARAEWDRAGWGSGDWLGAGMRGALGLWEGGPRSHGAQGTE